MTTDAIDRLCERIVGMFSVMGPSAFRLDAHQKLSDDVRAALEGESGRTEKLRRLQISKPRKLAGGDGSPHVTCAVCNHRWKVDEPEWHAPLCVAAPEGAP